MPVASVAPNSRVVPTPAPAPAAAAPAPVAPGIPIAAPNAVANPTTPQLAAPAASPAPVVTPGPLVTHEVIAQPTAAQLARAEELLGAYGKEMKRRFQRDGSRKDDGSWPGCFLVTEAKPLPDGMEIWVYTGHGEANDSLKMDLRMQV